ncbi:MAG TPA: excinuclease ABC subunit UvrC, partial [Gaiellaceae bacterium]|nr:excinuclease ABC subunit UvrC [Gaiellaceae bacterium]
GLRGMSTSVESRTERIEAQLKTVPAKPGVYLFRGAKDDVLYVGKAKSLRSRVRSYFQAGGDGRAGIPQLVDRVRRIEVIVTGTEVEALHLEQNLVKRHRPAFNVRLRDDKSFPYIAVTVEDDYPRVMFTRERHRRGVLYFGPYANAKKVRETLDVLNRVFQFRPCEGPKPGRHSGIPCLDFHIERCHAPCVDYISKAAYGEIIEGVINFLAGDTRTIVRELERQMREAAADERFEDAARYRNRLFAIENLAEKQGADRRETGSIDVIGIAADEARAAVQVFPLRGGKMIDRHGFHLENVAGQDVTTILEAFCLEYYGNAPSIPPQIIVPPEATGLEALEQFLTELRGSRVEVRAPARGEKKRLAELAAQNARVALESEAVVSEQKRARRVAALEELREALNLESLPLRIECYDISNIQGQEIVGSMVVFQDGIAKKAHYRKFAVRGLDGQDDFASMAEVVSRRFARLRSGVEADYDEGFATAPNLVVIDGGKGQLSAALAAMQAYELPRVAVISLAKRVEEVFVPGRSDPILLDRHSAGLQLLQRVRDEAHRFALTFHRQRRSARSRESLFDTLEGVGPVRRRALLQHFGSTEGVLAASQEQLEGVPGVPAKTARAIYAQLHRTGSPG